MSLSLRRKTRKRTIDKQSHSYNLCARRGCESWGALPQLYDREMLPPEMTRAGSLTLAWCNLYVCS